MNARQFLQYTRSLLGDSCSGLLKEDSVLLDMTNAVLTSLWSDWMQEDPMYWATRVLLSAADAEQVGPSHYRWRLPRWVQRVAYVRRATGITEDPYDAEAPSNDIALQNGYVLEERNKFTICLDAARDLWVASVRRPAPITIGALPQQVGVASNQILLQDDHALLDHTEDAYVQSEVSIEQDGAAGQWRVIESSAGNQALSGGGSYGVLATVDQDWDLAPAAGMIWSTSHPILDLSPRLVALMVCVDALNAIGSSESAAAYARLVEPERMRFVQSTRPRSLAATRANPIRYGSGSVFDPDRL